MKTLSNDYAFSADNVSERLTKREYFAGLALQGLVVYGAFEKNIHAQAESIGSNASEAIAVYAVDLADELIKALNKGGAQ